MTNKLKTNTMNYTLTQQNIIDDIDYIVDNYPEIAKKLCNIIPDDTDCYEDWTQENWNEVDNFLLNNYRS